MAKKKNNSSFQKFLKTRTGFYALFLVAALMMVTFIKSASPDPIVKSVLGREDDRSGKGEDKREEKEKEREEKKEEIRQKFNIETDGLKVKFESENGKVKREIEFKNKKDELDDEDEEELEDEIELEFELENDADIATDSSNVIITKNKIKAKSSFPLSIDLDTNQLIVTRPDGTTKAVAILPDQAVQNFMRHKKVELINVPGNDDPSGTDSAEIGDDSQDSTSSPTLDEENFEETEIELVEKDGDLIYEIKGKKKIKILGFIPVNVDTTGFVDATTGEVTGIDESLFVRFLSLISF